MTKQARQAQRLTESAQDRAIREASLVRAKRDAMAADGISWGMQEDAEEEPEVVLLVAFRRKVDFV